MTVQLRHTSEWLGTFGEPGNGDANAAVERVCQVVTAYLKAHDLPLALGVVRLDGEHGWLHRIARIVDHGLGYLVRCCDYKILKSPILAAALAAGAIARMTHEDTGVVRELFDLPAYPWKTLRGGVRSTRLVVARRRVPMDVKVTVGKRVGEWVYEMIATDRTASEWDAAQVFALYLERGAFERTLGEEDRELPTDRWVSYRENGEEVWQILCQWIWNLRLWRGVEALGAVPDRDVVDTLAEAIEGESVTLSETELVFVSDAIVEPAVEASVEPAVEASVEPAVEASVEPAVEAQVVAVPFGSGAFRQRSALLVVCPSGVEMHASERVHLAKESRIRYAAPGAKCAECEWSMACRGSTAKEARGRRITMRDGSSAAPPLASQPSADPVMSSAHARDVAPRWEARWEATPLWHETLRGAALRRYLPKLLAGQRVRCDVIERPSQPPPPSRRSQRAKRRTRWHERWSRNLLTTRVCTITLPGIHAELAKVVDLPTVRAG